MAIMGPEDQLSCIFLSDLYLIVDISQVNQNKISSLTQSIQ